MQRNSGIGGQAIMEGIMMRNREKYSIAVRNPEGEIEISVRDFRSVCPFSAAHRIPVIRGAVSFIDSLVTGVSFLGHLEGPEEVEGELGRRIMDSMEDLIAAMLDVKAFDRDVEDEVNLVADKARELAQTLGRKVSPIELAAEGEVTRDQIARAIRLTGGKIEDLDPQ